ncbi:MAG: DUF5693 family protein [Elusimicrobiota bacterium]
MFKKILVIYSVCILFFLCVCIIPLKNRIVSEINNSVALAIEYDDVSDFFGIEKLADFKTAGINTVVISDEKAKDFFAETDELKYKKLPPEKYLGCSPEKISTVSKLGLNIVLSVQGNISLIPTKIPNVTAVILSDDFYGELSPDFNYTFGIVEFTKQKEVKKILQESDAGFRIFKLRWEQDYKKNIDRIKRAVLERNVRIIILDLSQSTLENTVEYINQSKKALAEIGFRIETPSATRNINPRFSNYAVFTKIVSFFIALLSPICTLLFLGFNIKFSEKYSILKTVGVFVVLSLFAVLSGTAIAGLLATKNFMLGVELFRGIKVVSLLPILILIYLLYKTELKSFLKKPVLFGEIIFLGVLLFVVGFYILRTGNYGTTTYLEDNFRMILEKIFFVRPRLKEFLIGHPFMILAIYLRYKKNNPPPPPPFLWKPFFIVGIIGQISIINTFCHIHSPFLVSLLRTFNGICLGILLGIILIYLSQTKKNT